MDAREVGDITSRLKKVLSNVELLFEEEEDEVGCERRRFEDRYGDFSAQIDAREKERAEMLKSLAEVLDEKSQSPDMFMGSSGEGEEDSNVDLNSHIETTKMGFQKLEELKEEMKKLSSKGKPTEHLKKQKSDLKVKVVDKFKTLLAAKKQRSKNLTVGDFWKSAAEDIVHVLTRIRTEGVKDKEEVERELIKIEKMVARQAEALIRLEHQLSEKQKAIDSLTKTLAVANNENEMLNSEVDRYRDKVVILKKQVRVLSGDAEPTELVDNHAQTFLSMVSLMNAVNDEVSAASLLKEESLKSVKESQEYQAMVLRVENLEKKVIEKETQIMRMECGMSPSSLADVVQGPSPGGPDGAKPGMGRGEAPGSVAPPAKSSHPPQSDNTKTDIGRLIDEKQQLDVETNKLCVQIVEATREINTLNPKGRKPPSAKDKGTSGPAPEKVTTMSISDDTKTHIGQLTEEKQQLQVEMTRLRDQFMEATREIITLKYAVDVLPRADQSQTLESSGVVAGSPDSAVVGRGSRGGSPSPYGPGQYGRDGAQEVDGQSVGAQGVEKSDAATTSSRHRVSPGSRPTSTTPQSYVMGSRKLSSPYSRESGASSDYPRRGSARGTAEYPLRRPDSSQRYQSGRSATREGEDHRGSRTGRLSAGCRAGKENRPGRPGSTRQYRLGEGSPGRDEYIGDDVHDQDYRKEDSSNSQHVGLDKRRGLEGRLRSGGPGGRFLSPATPEGTSGYTAFPAKGFLRGFIPAQWKRQAGAGAQLPGGGSKEPQGARDEHIDPGMEDLLCDLQSCSQYMEAVLQDQIARLSEENQGLMKKLSEQSLRYFDQLYPHLLSNALLRDDTSGGKPRTGGKWPGVAQRRTSPFVRKDAFALMQSGGRFIKGRNAAVNTLEKMMFKDSTSWAFPGNTPQLWQYSKKSASAEAVPTQGPEGAIDTSDQGDMLASTNQIADPEHAPPKTADGAVKRGVREPLPFTRQTVMHTPELQQPSYGRQGDSGRSSDGDRRKQRVIPPSAAPRVPKVQKGLLPSESHADRLTARILQGEELDWEGRKRQFRAGIQAINRLDGTSLRVKQQMTKQLTKYFCLTEVKRAKEFQSRMKSARKSERNVLRRGRSIDYLPSNMLLKRIQSLLNDMEDTNRPESDSYQTGKLPRIAHTQSLSSLVNVPSVDQRGTTRHWIRLPKAKYPGRGYVVVQTDRFPVYRGELLKKNAENRVVGHRPVPKTHHQLNATHRLLLEKQMREQRVRDQQTLKNVVKLEEGMRFDTSLDEASGDDSSDVHHIIKHAHEQLFNPESMRQKYLTVLGSS